MIAAKLRTAGAAAQVTSLAERPFAGWSSGVAGGRGEASRNTSAGQL